MRKIEEYQTLTELSKRLPGRPSVSTIWRWCNHGVNGVRLPHAKLGKRHLVHPDDLEWFVRQCGHAGGKSDAPATNGNGREHAEAERRCEQMGV